MFQRVSTLAFQINLGKLFLVHSIFQPKHRSYLPYFAINLAQGCRVTMPNLYECFPSKLPPPQTGSLNPTPAVVRWQGITWPQCIQHRWHHGLWPVACHGFAELRNISSSFGSQGLLASRELHWIFLLICVKYHKYNHTSTKSGRFLLLPDESHIHNDHI